jgi:hypothetical protein
VYSWLPAGTERAATGAYPANLEANASTSPPTIMR